MKINRAEYDKIVNDIYYLNMVEIKTFFKKHDLPYTIYEASAGGDLKKTSIIERKGQLIEKMKMWLNGQHVKPTVIPYCVINHTEPLYLTKYSKVYYGQFNSTNDAIQRLLRQLTNNQFKFGAIAVHLIWDLWIEGKLVTYNQFAKMWIWANDNHNNPLIEWAYLTDMKKGMDRTKWKALRINKASKVLAIIDKFSRKK